MRQCLIVAIVMTLCATAAIAESPSLNQFLEIAATMGTPGPVTSNPVVSEPRSGLANGEDSLTIYAYPPPRRLDWATPGQLLRSFLGVYKVDRFKEDAMGHTIAHIDCRLPGRGGRYDYWASFSGQDREEADDKNKQDRLGMGMLFFDFIDGHIISGNYNVQKLALYDGNGKKPRYFRLAVKPDVCGRLKEMVDFFETFNFPEDISWEDLQARPAKDTLYFSAKIDPYDSYMARKSGGQGKVGGGCAPFGVALVKMAGAYDPLFNTAWQRRVVVSERLIGGPLTGRRVALMDIAMSDLGRQWVYPHYANQSLDMYDPQMIWDFIGSAQQCLRGGSCDASVRDWMARQPRGVSLGAPAIFTADLPPPPRGSGVRRGPQTQTHAVDGVIVQ